MAQVNPNIMDVIDTDKFATELAEIRDVTRKIIRSPEEVEAIREQRAQAEQAQAGAAMGVQAATAAKDMAMAEKTMRG